MYITPCLGVCSFDHETQVCSGCGRTFSEYKEWPNMNDDQRMFIMKRLGFGKRMSREERLRRYDRG